MRMCSPHNQLQSVSDWGVCGRVEAYNERSLCVKYRNQGVQTSFYESRGASEFLRILLKGIPGTQSFRRVASSNRFKMSERSHFCTSFSYVHYKLSSEHRKGDYTFKIDLQDAYLHVPIHPSSRKYLRFAFENKVYQLRVLSFGLNTAPQIFTRLGHTVTGYLHCLGILVIPYLDDWLVHHPDYQVLLRHQVQLLKTLFKDLVGFTLNRKKSELDFITGLQCFRATRSR